MSPFRNESLLIVDDEPGTQILLARMLARGGFHDVQIVSSAEEARRLLAVSKIDLVLTDMHMPGGSGLELLEHLHESRTSVAALMVTGADDRELAGRALALGAYGYIIKPLRESEVLIGVSNALTRRDLELENRCYRDHLEATVRLRTAELRDTILNLELSERRVRLSRSETIKRLAMAGEFHDEDTGFHVLRMSLYCEILARACGATDLVDAIREAGSLHDVGKIGVSDSILLKPGPLSPEERFTMQLHAEIGHGILKDSDSPLLKLAAEIALVHHEKVDGSGYPNGLVGDAIPLAGRIAAIADVFDALTSDRVYRKAFPVSEAVDMMNADAGTHFDAELLTIFWGALPEVLAVGETYRGDSDRVLSLQ